MPATRARGARPCASVDRSGRRAHAALLLALVVVHARADERFDEFLVGFRAAAANGDAQALSALTRQPFLYEGEARERAEFERVVVPALFTLSVRACLADAEPLPEQDAQVVFCAPYAFYFRRSAQGAWQLDEFGTDGEEQP